MVDKTLTTITSASTLDGTELDYVVQGGNSRKVTTNRLVGEPTHAATGKTTPVDADEMGLLDSAASFVLKKVTLTNFKAFLKTYFDTLYTGSGSGVTTSRQVISGGGLTGGGDLSADRTLAVGAGTGIAVNADDVALNVNGLTEDTAPDESADFLLTYDTSASTHKKVKPDNVRLRESFIIAVGDETTAITTGTAKVTWRMPYAFTVTDVRASLNTVSSSGTPTIDINEGGTTILSTKLTIDASELTSTTAATPAVISDAALADDAEMTIDIDTAGTGAKGLKVVIIGVRA